MIIKTIEKLTNAKAEPPNKERKSATTDCNPLMAKVQENALPALTMNNTMPAIAPESAKVVMKLLTFMPL